MTSRLYVAEILPRSEALAVSELGNQGVETLWPRYVRARPRRRQSAVASLFPGYLFVRFDVLSDEWGCISGTRGVRRLICSAVGRPVAVPDRVAAGLAEHFGRGPVPDLEDALLPFRVGTSLRVLEGPFAGLVASCERSTRSRVWVLLSWLGRVVSAELPVTAVEVAA